MSLIKELIHLGVKNVAAFDYHTNLNMNVTPATTFTGDFILTDPKACLNCNIISRQPQSYSSCNQVVMKVHSDNTVIVLNMNSLFEQLPQKITTGLKSCDFIISDDEEVMTSRRIAFCDLTCSEEKYINPGGSDKYPNGKREYAVTQMLSTSDFLSKDPLFKAHLHSATSRRLIFGIRDKTNQPINRAAKAIRGFINSTPSSGSLSLTTIQHINNLRFEFIEVRYPFPLKW